MVGKAQGTTGGEMTEELKPCPNCEPCADHPRAEPDHGEQAAINEDLRLATATLRAINGLTGNYDKGQQALELLRDIMTGCIQEADGCTLRGKHYDAAKTILGWIDAK